MGVRTIFVPDEDVTQGAAAHRSYTGHDDASHKIHSSFTRRDRPALRKARPPRRSALAQQCQT
jgi:hypothetical protein